MQDLHLFTWSCSLYLKTIFGPLKFRSFQPNRKTILLCTSTPNFLLQDHSERSIKWRISLKLKDIILWIFGNFMGSVILLLAQCFMRLCLGFYMFALLKTSFTCGLVRSRLQNDQINARLNSTVLLFVFFALTVSLKSGKWLVCFILCWLFLELFFRLKWNNCSIMNSDKQSLQVVIFAKAENHSEYCQSSFVNYVMLWVDSELCLVLFLKANCSFWLLESVYEE